MRRIASVIIALGLAACRTPFPQLLAEDRLTEACHALSRCDFFRRDGREVPTEGCPDLGVDTPGQLWQKEAALWEAVAQRSGLAIQFSRVPPLELARIVGFPLADNAAERTATVELVLGGGTTDVELYAFALHDRAGTLGFYEEEAWIEYVVALGGPPRAPKLTYGSTGGWSLLLFFVFPISLGFLPGSKPPVGEWPPKAEFRGRRYHEGEYHLLPEVKAATQLRDPRWLLTDHEPIGRAGPGEVLRARQGYVLREPPPLGHATALVVELGLPTCDPKARSFRRVTFHLPIPEADDGPALIDALIARGSVPLRDFQCGPGR